MATSVYKIHTCCEIVAIISSATFHPSHQKAFAIKLDSIIAQNLILGVKPIYSNSTGVSIDRIIPADGDCLNINDAGIWQISGGTSIDEGPAHSPKKNEWFYVFAYGSVGVLILLAIQTRGAYSYIGVKRDGDITWKQITVTT